MTRERPPTLSEAFDAVRAPHGKDATPVSHHVSGGREFEGYDAPENAISAFPGALDRGLDRVEIEAAIRADGRDMLLPSSLKIQLVQHALAAGRLPDDVERECMIALSLYCDPGDPRRENAEQYLSALEGRRET